MAPADNYLFCAVDLHAIIAPKEVMMKRAAVVIWLGKAVLIAAVCLGTAACTTEEERSARRHADVREEGGGINDAADPFHVDVDLFHRTAGRRWRRAAEHVFPVRDESYIRAEAVLHHVRPQRTYSVHLVWIRPDGRELFRRYAEVTRRLIGLPDGVVPDDDGALPPALMEAWRTAYGDKKAEELAEHLIADPHALVPVDEVLYKKAIDLAFAQRRITVGNDPSVTLDSRFDISRGRGRALGSYHLRVYLDRRLLREIPFVVED
jgi:hypothetical protein